MSDKSYFKVFLIAYLFAQLCVSNFCFAEKLPQITLVDAGGNVCVLQPTARLNLVAVVKPGCPDCERELQTLHTLVVRPQFSITLVVYGQSEKSIASYADKIANSKIKILADPQRSTKKAFEIKYLPFFCFFDAQAEIVQILESSGKAADADQLMKIVDKYEANE